MDERIASQYCTDARDEHRRQRHDDAVREIPEKARDMLKHVAVVAEVELRRPQLPRIRVWNRRDRAQEHPENGQDDDDTKNDDRGVQQNRAQWQTASSWEGRLGFTRAGRPEWSRQLHRKPPSPDCGRYKRERPPRRASPRRRSSLPPPRSPGTNRRSGRRCATCRLSTCTSAVSG